MTRRTIFRLLVLVSVTMLAALTLIGATTRADTSTAVVQAMAAFEPDAPPPLVINYQGRLVDPTTGETKPDGPYPATFAIYDADSGGTLLWSETQSIVLSKGLFSVALGNVNPIDPGIFNGNGRWLGVTINPDPGELLPRIRVAHAPYAIWSNLAGNATNADRLGGSLPSAYAPAAHTHDATNIVSGNLPVERYHAIDSLSLEGYLGNAAGDIALNNGALQTTLNADLLDNQHSTAFAPSSHSHDAAAITSGTLSTDRFSAYADLAADSRIGALSGQVAAGDHVHTGATIVDGSIGTADLADGSVTSAKIADGNVTTGDLANSSVTTAKIADGAVTAAKLSSGIAPIAYAFIYANGTKSWGTSNVASSWNASSQWYEITISGYSYYFSEFITVVTTICSPGWSVSTSSVSGYLIVRIANASNAYTQCGFQFVTYH
jgi:hypothetical protein